MLFALLVFIISFLGITTLSLFFFIRAHFNKTPPLMSSPQLKKFPPSPRSKNLNLSGVDDWISVFSDPLNLKSECIIVFGKEEQLGFFSVDKEHIILQINTVKYKTKISTLQITNIYFARSKINKNNFIELNSPTEIIPPFYTVLIRFRHGYQFEFWLYYIKTFQQGRAKYKQADDAFVTLFRELARLTPNISQDALPWVELTNFFLARAFYIITTSDVLKRKMKESVQRKLDEIKSSVIPEITCTEFFLGIRPPLLKTMVTHIPTGSLGRFWFDSDVSYQSDIHAEISMKIKVPFTQTCFPVFLYLALPSLEGKSRVEFADVPSKSVYISFHETPEIHVDYKLQVGRSYFHPSQTIDNIIHFALNMIVTKFMVLPDKIQIAIPQISEVVRQHVVNTFNPFVDKVYTIPDLVIISPVDNLRSHHPDIFRTEEARLNKSKTEKIKREMMKFTEDAAVKYFTLACNGIFNGDLRTEKTVEKQRKISQKEQEKKDKQHQKELLKEKQIEKRHTVSIPIEFIEKANGNTSPTEKLEKPDLLNKAETELLESSKLSTDSGKVSSDTSSERKPETPVDRMRSSSPKEEKGTKEVLSVEQKPLEEKKKGQFTKFKEKIFGKKKDEKKED
ncbi:hypothetical protein EIN_134460 [Entamoeba invadens IP1]|uniref:SMP-LTD domain-containing protein n=1 Tax=Entamoeba invadens IP1 TaxID=370355 RepID=A0A0A1TXA2_ENTIV|nr:hypothetical protein EIN_134460 [Entamoeba invadens IP1]ELP85902.1 hypothetical protein EIN_134460 [Entamoeba invadens IP1]|eukprot:XP_004185248.1 hypothetical protein EIN_134460 [Entamoeba invadens IP1]